MKLNILGKVATLDGARLSVSDAVEEQAQKKVDITEEDIFSGSQELEKLAVGERMELLTDTLERLVREQTGLEESFYDLVIRAQKAEAELDRPDGVPETVWNLNMRRLEQENRRLGSMLPYLRETLSKIELIRIHLKVVRLGPGEVELNIARRDCILALDEFIARAKKCMTDADSAAGRLRETLAELKARA